MDNSAQALVSDDSRANDSEEMGDGGMDDGNR